MAIIRKMTIDDVEGVMAVEEASFAVPWSADTFHKEIDDNPYAHYYVVEKEGRIIGYCGLWLIIDEAHITNIAIHPEQRGNKYGERLFRHTCKEAIEHGAIQLSLEVRVSNTAAQHMYRKFGMVPGGIRKRYYTDNGEDALVMWVGLK
ncbi:[SSU ribosomal protein S18P]-alanine acetyltransferase [Halobacillus karajensis]|uniref:[Ribosomal protein bS18]-alanine N-acetyltransferase n=1 Tax=Halobacillus karajensis TaxID=195088 RepID=A0A059NZ24_9BACI|nr:ribosomal protein S18-alanine N-acetyltransferase [Halobacillus karajensis]CDQ20356.1 ribosomal-protein-alanine N-acetyltransferase [Halobacillus karajensis]CDQ23576.1 ribosomal-protein-alanine N-acetyltransferase [Halobacillus karajensis]CDQ27058.1 ribosomal-protein-alanine N-acetyltransferase [Halobacillus karajensis]SEI13096.1 [SSU ribosomal protein S18P]-alanine acetyltransferase [Halobacillus karajensis]